MAAVATAAVAATSASFSGGPAMAAAASAAATSTAVAGCCATPTAGQQRWRLHVSYDGTDFAGFQKQTGDGSGNVPAVQGELELALSRVFRAEVTTVCASRTDKGVHARGQVCHFDAPALWGPQETPGLDPGTALRRLRRELPGSVLPVTLAKAAPDFHARLSATSKRYSYRLATVDAVSPFEARFCWCVGPVDLEAMALAAGTLDGRLLNYSAFAMGEPELHYHGGVEKNVSVAVREESPGRALVLVSCDRFLYRMVRRVVGALVEVGLGRLQPEALSSADRQSVPTAPAGGLCLDEVFYASGFETPEAVMQVPPDLAPPVWE